MLGFAQEWLLLGLGVTAFMFEAYALVDSLRFAPQQYLAVGKRTKGFWTILTTSAAIVGFLSLPAPIGRSGGGPLSLLGLAAIVIAGVYLADVRPALRASRPRPPRPSRGGW
jgi:hypothetical protein